MTSVASRAKTPPGRAQDGDATVRTDLDQPTQRLSRSEAFAITAEAKLLRRLYESLAGKYELLGRLGQGGMGAVYLARDPALDRHVAIKVMLPELVSGRDVAERFKREARTVASLNHPNIIPVYAVHETGELAYFVMRYVEGRSLCSVLQHHGRLPMEIVESILRQVGRGLAYAHRQGVIHRDIKPANIMIDENGWALIADFGIAKVRGSHDLTVTGTTIGTPSYMSPEQWSDLEVTAASDQYALGIVAYEMLTGRPPFRGTTIASVVKQHLFDPPPPIDQVFPECPAPVVRAVTRMLAKSPAERWSSIEEAVGQVGGLLPADSEARMRIADVARHGRTAPVTLFETAPSTPTTAPVAATRPIRRTRGQHVLFGLGGGALGTAALAVALLAFRGPASAEETLPIPQATREQTLAAAQDPESSAPPAVRSDTEPRSPSTGVETQPAALVAADPGPELEAEAPVTPPSAEPSSAQVGSILLGTRGLAAVLYVEGAAQGAISGLRSWRVAAGTVTLSIRLDGCAPWDSTVVVPPNEEVRIGYRSPTCDD